MTQIKDLPHPYKELALANQKLQGNEPDESKDLSAAISQGGFIWVQTKERDLFWNRVYNGGTPELTPAIKANYPDIFPVENKNNRQVAMIWWNALSEHHKINLTDIYYHENLRVWHSLTGREIEFIWGKEAPVENKEVLVEGKDAIGGEQGKHSLNYTRAKQTLKEMDLQLTKLKGEVTFREYIGFELCLNIFKERYQKWL